MRRAIRPGESASEVIVRAVADLTGQDPSEMQPIARAIDSDALDSLFMRAPGDGPETLTLLFCGCRVTVEADAVTVEELPAASADLASERATPDG